VAAPHCREEKAPLFHTTAGLAGDYTATNCLSSQQERSKRDCFARAVYAMATYVLKVYVTCRKHGDTVRLWEGSLFVSQHNWKLYFIAVISLE